MRISAQQQSDYQRVQQSLEASEEKDRVEKQIRGRISAISDKMTLEIYADRIRMGEFSDALKKRVNGRIKQRMEEL